MSRDFDSLMAWSLWLGPGRSLFLETVLKKHCCGWCEEVADRNGPILQVSLNLEINTYLMALVIAVSYGLIHCGLPGQNSDWFQE